jgi:hypothetical protein
VVDDQNSIPGIAEPAALYIKYNLFLRDILDEAFFLGCIVVHQITGRYEIAAP